MNIFQKLVEIQKSVRSLGKDESAGFGSAGYRFVSGSKVLDIIRPQMDKLGLLLIPQIDSIDNHRIDYQTKQGAKSEMLTNVKMTFIWIDAESGEKLSVPFGANGMNNWDKGLGSALTYAERYFLLKFFHIATDQDDVDFLPLRGNEDFLPLRGNEDFLPLRGNFPGPAQVEQQQQKKKPMMHRNHQKWQEMLNSVLEGKFTWEKLTSIYDYPQADLIEAKAWVLERM